MDFKGITILQYWEQREWGRQIGESEYSGTIWYQLSQAPGLKWRQYFAPICENKLRADPYFKQFIISTEFGVNFSPGVVNATHPDVDVRDTVVTYIWRAGFDDYKFMDWHLEIMKESVRETNDRCSADTECLNEFS
jgi:hypothetical protein